MVYQSSNRCVLRPIICMLNGSYYQKYTENKKSKLRHIQGINFVIFLKDKNVQYPST